MYNIYGNPLLVLTKGILNLVEINAFSTYEKPIDHLELKVPDLKLNKSLTLNSTNNRYSVELSQEETSAFASGEFYYFISVIYKDGTSEKEAYSAKCVVR